MFEEPLEDKPGFDQVALPESFGFGDEAEESFEAEFAGPAGWGGDGSGDVVDRGSAGEKDVGGDLFEVVEDPVCLLGRAHADPTDCCDIINRIPKLSNRHLEAGYANAPVKPRRSWTIGKTTV
jgi:hypothetical protein